MTDKFDVFAKKLEEELSWRYQGCEDFAATPSSILLSVLNAVAEARNAVAVEVVTQDAATAQEIANKLGAPDSF